MSPDSAERARIEADLVANRIEELREGPLSGGFDLVHLKSVHAYIFQDLPHHRPGVTRANAANWKKRRGLEGRAELYDVPYRSRGVATQAARVLKRFGGPAKLAGIPVSAAAEQLAALYGDLDHAHAFYEGNSRTLREFTRELAAAAGFALDWIGTGVGAAERNALYLARDLAVYEREFPGLDEARAMSTSDLREYEAFFTVERLRAAVGDNTLQFILATRLRRDTSVGGEADAPPDFRPVKTAA